MNQQGARIETEKQVFGAAADFLQCFACKQRGEISGYWPAQTGVTHDDGRERGTSQSSGNAATRRFNFGKLRHGVFSLCVNHGLDNAGKFT